MSKSLPLIALTIFSSIIISLLLFLLNYVGKQVEKAAFISGQNVVTQQIINDFNKNGYLQITQDGKNFIKLKPEQDVK